MVFQPLALLAAFSVGFRSVAHVKTAGVPYYLFVLTGLIVWTYFQAVVMASTGSIVNNYALVRWTACPRLALPLATLVSNLPSIAVPWVVAIVAAAISGYLSINALLIPLLLMWLLVLIGALALLLSALTVRARDVLSVAPFLLQIALFLSPVGYSANQLGPTLRFLISLNPLTGMIEAWRWSILGAHSGLAAIVLSLAFTLVGAIAGWRMFARLEVVMADEI